MSKPLDLISNIATVGACVAIITFVLTSRVTQTTNGPANQGVSRPTYAVGEQVPSVPGASFSKARHTLVMVLRQDCHFCAESMPFYKTLTENIAAHRSSSNSLQLVVLTTDNEASSQAYLSTQGLKVDQVVSIQPSQMLTLKVSGTPTLMLLDQKGIVENSWIGKLTTDGERAAVRALTKLL